VLAFLLFVYAPVAQRGGEAQCLGGEVAVNGQARASKGAAAKGREVEAGSAVDEASSVALKLQNKGEAGQIGSEGSGTGTRCLLPAASQGRAPELSCWCRASLAHPLLTESHRLEGNNVLVV